MFRNNSFEFSNRLEQSSERTKFKKNGP